VDLPLFPLHTVLCPGVALPLHVFEDRYREMIRRCLADRTPFGVVLIRNGREVGEVSEPVELALAMIGTEAEIREASRYSDGRFDLVAVGTRRFALDSVVAGREPYLVGRVTPLEDSVGDPDRARALVAHVSRRFVRYLELLRAADGERAEELDIRVEVDVEVPDGADGSTRAGDARGVEPDADAAPPARWAKVPDNPATLSYLLSGIIQVEPSRRQQLLEADTAEDRLEAVDRLLDRELMLLGRRLRHYAPDPRLAATRRS
jgi:Lon protease-like protein